MSVARPPAEIRGRRVVVRRYSSIDAFQLHEAIVDSIEHLAPWMPWAGLEPLEQGDRERLIAEWAGLLAPHERRGGEERLDRAGSDRLPR